MNWEQLYRGKLTDLPTALSHIQSGNRIYIGGGVGAPLQLIDGLTSIEHPWEDVEIVHILTFAEANYVKPQYAKQFRQNSLFIGHNVRTAVQSGAADFTPVFLSEIPRLFRQKILPLDVALISLSPPDNHGFCSFGVEVGATKPAAESATLIIAEINKQMPRTLGDSFIHLSQLTHIIETDYPLPEAKQGGSSETLLKIGEHIAQLIPNEATLQMGIGAIPDAVLQNLTNHRNLGIHTELFSDGIVDMVEAGVINCSKKNFHPGKIIAGFVLGSKQLYQFIHNNPMIELHPIDYVNDPFNIARNDKMVAINSAIQVDITGQIAADSIGTKFYSGVGGQVDFIRGAARSNGGIPIIALESTAKKGTVSRIIPTLYTGSGVTTTRNDVHYVVTEHGVAYLYGKTIRQRTNALIQIADPQFRDQLSYEAKELGYL